MVAQAVGLVLCTCGTLGKGTLRIYPSLRVPTRAMAMATMWAMVTAMGLVGDEEGKGKGGKGNYNDYEGGR